VQHNGTASMPLTVNSFMVTSLTLDEQASLPVATSQAFGHHHLKGIVISGIVGGVVGFLMVVGTLLTIWMKSRRGRSESGLEPTPFPEVVAITDNEATELPSSPRKRSRNVSLLRQDTALREDETMNQRLRWGNLEIQQRVATLLGLLLSRLLASMGERRPSTEPVIHTDSGWRMPQEDPGLNHSNEIRVEVPPNYSMT
jgi:hypothetical protein